VLLLADDLRHALGAIGGERLFGVLEQVRGCEVCVGDIVGGR